jgi:hypothetical protein
LASRSLFSGHHDFLPHDSLPGIGDALNIAALGVGPDQLAGGGVAARQLGDGLAAGLIALLVVRVFRFAPERTSDLGVNALALLSTVST